MVIRLLPSQVPKIWEQIKATALRTGGVSDNAIKQYCNLLLVNLLSNKAQCFVAIDNEDRTLRAVGLTRFTTNIITGDKTLFIDSIFALQPMEDKHWMECLITVQKFAQNSKCKYIEGISHNERIFELAQRYGFQETGKHFSVKV